MNTPKHTPGPWHAALGLKLISDVYAVGVNGQRVFIAECATQRDALLIAAAPAMYALLKRAAISLQEYCAEINGDMNDSLACEIEATIAQAEGVSHE